ncbi:low affinity immunoglobulin gamma Fc region receptor II-like [Scomber scombrus]
MLEIIQLGTQSLKKTVSDAVFLRITPNRQQHFQLASVSLNCDGIDDSIQLRGIRTNDKFTPACQIKRTQTGSFCTIDRAFPGDSGEYWCETNGGERSNSISITVTGGSVILESPVLPVTEGDNVTLRCRDKKNSTNLQADFYKDGVLMQSSPVAEMTINSVSKSDEGLYRCSISDGGTSPESWLAVRVFACHKETQSSSSDDTSHDCLHSCHIYLILRAVFTIVMVALLLLLVGLLHCGKLKVT